MGRGNFDKNTPFDYDKLTMRLLQLLFFFGDAIQTTF